MGGVEQVDGRARRQGFNRTIREMIERGRLSKIRTFRVQTLTSLDHVSTRAGDLAHDELAQAVNVSTRNVTAVKPYLDYAPWRKGIAFTVDVAHAKNLAAAFREVGIKAEAVTGHAASGTGQCAGSLSAWRAEDFDELQPADGRLR